MSVYHILSTLIIAIILVGLWKRHEVKAHVNLMLTAFGLDVLLVIAIEINRSAIEKTISHAQLPQNHALLLFHVAISLLTIILYVILTILGFQILKGKRNLLPLHRNLGIVFLICRLTNYATSFMIV